MSWDILPKNRIQYIFEKLKTVIPVVKANPSDTATNNLTKLGIDGTNYNVTDADYRSNNHNFTSYEYSTSTHKFTNNSTTVGYPVKSVFNVISTVYDAIKTAINDHASVFTTINTAISNLTTALSSKVDKDSVTFKDLTSSGHRFGTDLSIVSQFTGSNDVSHENTNLTAIKTVVNNLADYTEESVANSAKQIASTQTATGNPLTLTDCAPINAESLKVELEPKQDLHGYDFPWVGGAHYNKWNEEWENGYYNVQTGDGVSDANYVRSKNANPIDIEPQTEYCAVVNGNYPFVNDITTLLFYDENGTYLSYTTLRTTGGLHQTFTTPQNARKMRFYMTDYYGATYNHDIAINYPSSITTYSPFENICPITGYTQTSVETLTDIQSYYDIQTIVRAGKAQEVFNIGDEIPVKYTDTNGTQYDMPFRVVAFQNIELQDGTTKQGMFLQSKYATLEGVQFDAPEPDNTLGSGGAKDDNVASYGYNRWSESGIRAWLNSDATANNWWGSTFERGGQTVSRRAADVAPTQLASVNGFLRGLPSSFVDVLGKVKIQTSCNTVTDSGVTDTTYDKIFLASLEQMYTTPQASGVEGEYFEYWKEALGLNSPSSWHPTTYEAYKTYALENHNSAQRVRLRSATRGNSYNTWYVYSGGSISGYTAYDALRSAPVCVIC